MPNKADVFAEICDQLGIVDPRDNSLFNTTDGTVTKDALGEILVGITEEFVESSTKLEILSAIFRLLGKVAREPQHMNDRNDTVTKQALEEILDGIRNI